jgi:hypothetical protein
MKGRQVYTPGPYEYRERIYSILGLSPNPTPSQCHKAVLGMLPAQYSNILDVAADLYTEKGPTDPGRLRRYIEGVARQLGYSIPSATLAADVTRLYRVAREWAHSMHDSAAKSAVTLPEVPVRADTVVQGLRDIMSWCDRAGEKWQSSRLPVRPRDPDEEYFEILLEDIGIMEPAWEPEQPLSRIGRELARTMEADSEANTVSRVDSRTESPLKNREEFSVAVGLIQRLVYILDYAMLLNIDYEGCPRDTPITMPDAKARKQKEAEVDKYLHDHRQELAGYRRVCPKCGASYADWGELTHCRTQHLIAHAAQESAPESEEEGYCVYETCGAELQRVPNDASDAVTPFLREEAGFKVTKLFHEINTRVCVSGWLASEPLGRAVLSFGEAVTVTLDAVLDGLRDMMTRYVNDINVRLGLASPFELRRNLLPRGKTLSEIYEDYETLRDAIIGRTHQLTAAHPEWTVTGRGYIEALEFAPAVSLPNDLKGNKKGKKPKATLTDPQQLEGPIPETDTTLIYLCQAAEMYNIPKSTLSKAKDKQPGEPGYLWSGHKGRRVFFRKADMLKLSRSREKLKSR